MILLYVSAVVSHDYTRSHAMTHELESLRVILNEAVDSIIAACKQKNEEFPSLNDSAHPSEFSPLGIRNDPVVSQAIKLGVAAAHQLIVTLQSPMQTMVGIGAYVSSAGYTDSSYVHTDHQHTLLDYTSCECSRG